MNLGVEVWEDNLLSEALSNIYDVARVTKEKSMSVAKIIEISSESPKSFEDAIQNGITRAAKTIHGIKSAWVKEQHVVVDNGKVTLYRVDLKLTFVLD